MQKDLHLFIGGAEVEFSSNPSILYNYSLTDITNPTAVKNSFSKAIDIPSTPANDDIFNHFWNLERYQTDNLTFSPIEKVPFQLFYEGALIERGYAKLNSIKRANHNGTYNISLFGGLGTFFYNLSYDEAGGSNDKKNLASLYYISDTIHTEPDLDFRINKDAVKEAWDGITGYGDYDDKWNVINFIPCYNGIPDDFDSDRVMINYNGLGSSPFVSVRTDGGVTYMPDFMGQQSAAGFAMADTEEMTEWETFDLRSYLQRPAVSVKRVLQACFEPENNGGYQVKLDSHFFNFDNCYWNDGWVTLPMLRDLEVAQGESETVYGASLAYSTGLIWVKYYDFQLPAAPTLSDYTNAEIKLQARFTPSSSSSYSTLYGNRTLNVSTGLHIFNGHTYVRRQMENTALIVQLQALSAGGDVVAMSDAYCLGGSDKIPNSNISIWDKFTADDGIEGTKYHYVSGTWKQSGGSYVFCDAGSQPVTLSFNLNNDARYSKLRLKIQTPTGRYTKYAWSGSQTVLDSPTFDNAASPLYTAQISSASGDYTSMQAQVIGRVMGRFSFDINEFSVTETDYTSLFSDTLIPKNKLLATDYTPGEFLLSWAKMFGLYFYYDASEEADDVSKYPAGVIHIYDRDTFYDEEHIDITERIDRGKDMSITPTNAESKWYEFKQEQADSEAAKIYEENYGHTYGRQLVNTNYNFNSETKNLYDGNVFKAGIMVREKGRYYRQPVDGIPQYTWNGVTYQLFNGSDTVEIDLEITRPSTPNLNALGLKNYDMFPRLQCHTEGNSPSDGSGILVFYKGYANTLAESGYVDYWLTDDLDEFNIINDGQPCWILTNSEIDAGGNRIAHRLNILPQFTRDWINFGLQEGYVVHSWNFGHPQAIYSPNTYTTSGDCIYDKFWKSYINDFYSVNSKTVSCYVRLPRYAHPSLFRKWWHFDNAIWVLISIKDYQIDKDVPVLCTFVKVQDTANYALDRISPIGEESIILDTYTIGCTGGTIGGTVYLQAGGQWFANDYASISGRDEQGNRYTQINAITPAQGSGLTSRFNVYIPANTGTSKITWTIRLEDDYDNALTAAISQPSCAQGEASLRWNSTAVDLASGSTSGYYGWTYENLDPQNVGVWWTAEWLNCNINGSTQTVLVSAEANPLNTPRTASVEIYLGGQQSVSAVALFTQAAGTSTLSLDTTELVWSYIVNGAYAIPRAINVSASTQWTAATTNAQFTVTPAGGSGDATLSANTADINSGYADITGSLNVTDGITTKTVALTQYGVPSCDTGNFSFLKAGGDATFQISTHYPVYFSGQTEWCKIYMPDGVTQVTDGGAGTLFPEDGETAGNFIMRCGENEGNTTRTATITMYHWLSYGLEEGSYTFPINITQRPYD